MGHNQGGFVTGQPTAAVDAAEHMADRIREASALAAQHVGMPVVSQFRGKYPPPEVDWGFEPAPTIEELLPAGQWPTTAHLRLHYLADIGNGWFCRDCGIGLIDVCRDDDTVSDSEGRRVIRPGCNKRLPTRDHRIPQQLNGSNGPDNLDLVCRPCNSSKGAA